MIDACCVHGCSKVIEATVHCREPIAEASQATRRGLERRLVAVDPEDAERRVRLQDQLGMSATPERRVEDRSGGHCGEHGDDLRCHHRLVMEGLVVMTTHWLLSLG